MIRNLLFFMWIISFSGMVFSITNIESERLNNTEQGTSGNISLSLDGRIGNSDKVALGSALKLIRAYKRDEWIAIMSRDYAEVDSEVNTDETLVHLRYLTKHSSNWGHEIFVQYQEDKFSSLARRSLVGAGVRYTLSSNVPKEEQTHANHFGFGFFHEDEEYVPGVIPDDEQSIRLNVYWAFKNKISDIALYTSTLYFQPKMNRLSDEKGLWQNSLTLSVTSTISLSLTWDVEHDTHTPDGANDTETSYNSVLIYNF